MGMKKNNTASRMRKWRHGWFALVLTVLVICAVAAINLAIGAAEEKWALKIDASPNSITSFTDETYQTLDALDQDVHVYLLFSKGDTSSLRTQLEEIAAKFRARSSHITVDTIDPDLEPNRVNQYKGDSTQALRSGSMIVTNADESRVRLIPYSEMYSYTQNQQTGEIAVTTFNGESKLTQGIRFVTDENTPVVYFLTGHEEIASSYCGNLLKSLQADNIEVHDLSLGQGTALKPGDTLVIAAPQLDITEAEYKQLQTFLDNGGRMLFAEDAQNDMSKTPNFVKLLGYYGIEFKDGMVVEDQSESGGWLLSPNYIVPKLDAEHAITKDAGSARLILPSARAIKRTEMPLSGWNYAELLTTSDKAYVKALTGDTDILTVGPNDEVGKQALSVAVQYQPDQTKDTRIVAVGSVYTLVNSDIYNSSSNSSFTRMALNWLINRQDNTYVRGKAIADTALAIPNQGVLLGLSGIVVIAIPLIVLILGVIVFLKRRRL